MPVSGDRWVAVSESEFPWEREALAWLRDHLPDDPNWRVWSNFEFIADDGSINEVDVLVFSPVGLFLVEIKSRPGRVEGDSRTWTWTTDGRRHIDDNPIFLADKKAKRLKSLLRRQDAFRKGRLSPPFIAPLVFLSAEKIDNRLEGVARSKIHCRDRPTASGEVGIVGALRGDTLPASAAGRHIERRVASALLRALDQAGIRPSHRHRRVGDFELESLLQEGERYQDWQAVHVSMPNVRRRVRIHPYGTADNEEERRALVHATQREFQVLQGVEHPGILRLLEYKESERGPALIFDHDPTYQRFDFFLREHAAQLTDDNRLSFLRQLAEALRYAHAKRLYHRGLSPQNILVRQPESQDPELQIFNWRLAARAPGSDQGTSAQATGTIHLERYAEDVTAGYIAPEAWTRPDALGPHLDVFSLGAIAYHLFAGQPPATTLVELTEAIKAGPGLQIITALNDAPFDLQYLIQESTDPDISRRTATVDEFLELLNEVEKELTTPLTDETVSPFYAKKSDRIDGGYKVIERIGSGSSSIALLVEGDEDDPARVLKVARDEAHDSRVAAEGKALEGLHHQNVVRLFAMTELAGRTVLLLERAGDRTLARRLRDDGRPSLDLLERWGDDLLSAVLYLEEKGVAHRDIKPDNIGIGSVGQRGRLRLILFDFSLASTPAESIYAGTRPYLDPFLVHRTPRRWDLYAERYATAMTLYEMATGTLPSWGDGNSEPALLDCEVTIDRGLFDPHVREQMTEFFSKALRREPRERFDNAEEMLRAWRRIFEAATAHEAAAEAGDPLEKAVRELTPQSAIVELGYTPAALSVLEGMGVHTVRELLSIDRLRFRYLSSVADRTRKEIRLTAKRLAQLRPDLAPGGVVPATSEGGAERGDVDYLADRLLPKDAEPEEHNGWRAVETYLGLAAAATDGQLTWPTIGEAAKRAEATRRDLVDTLVTARERWLGLKPLREIREAVGTWLSAQGNVMTPRELAASLLAARGSMEHEPARSQKASAVVRAVIEAETASEEPRFTIFGDGTPLVIAASETQASYALTLGSEADRLAQIEPLPSPQRVQEALAAVPLTEGAEAMTPQRRLRIAVGASMSAALSSREEIYPKGLVALRAVRLSLGSLIGPRGLNIEQVRQRVLGRYPEAEPLPGRPALDQLLQDAGSDLEWDSAFDHGKGGYVSRVAASGLSGSSGTLSRYATTNAPEESSIPAQEALRFEDQLAHREQAGGFLAMSVHPRHAARAEAEIRERFDVLPLSLDRLIISALRQKADELGADWRMVLQADATGRKGADWGRLRQLAQHAWSLVDAEIRKEQGTVLLLYPGLLARYDLIQPFSKLCGEIGAASASAPTSLWLLIPMENDGMPAIDGTPVPVIGEAEWTRVPETWLQNLHRGKAA